MNGGRLMCETRNDTRSEHPPREREHTSSRGAGAGTRGRGGYRTSSVRPPVQSEDDQVEWLLVKRKRTMPHTVSDRGRGRRPVAELS